MVRSMPASVPSRAPGRPRSPAADAAILATTIRLLTEQGYDAMSIDGVAAAAGVGKATIYRRYPGKRELVVAAISSIAATLPPPPDSGSTRNDLRVLIRQTLDVVARGGVGFAMMGTLLARERDDPELMALFRSRVLAPRLEVIDQLLRRGIDRGDVRPDIAIDVVPQAIVGAIFAGRVIGASEDEPWLDTVFDTVWRGIAAG
jgi:AcrR family transcriptional regulator